MSEKKEFPTAVLASISSGILMCDNFSQVHEAAEFLMGHAIWTHHFTNHEFQRKMEIALLEQYPDMPKKGDVTTENWRTKLTETESAVGATCVITRGSGKTAISPFDGFPKI